MNEEYFEAGGQIVLIPHNVIRLSSTNTRKSNDINELERLAQSIRENGLLQPITVRQISSIYQVVTGERRFRAAKIAGLCVIPCIIIRAEEEMPLIYSLLENLQHKSINFFDEARAYDLLMTKYNMPINVIASKLALSVWDIQKKLNLLKIAEDLQEIILGVNLSEEIVYELSKLRDHSSRESTLREIIDKDLNIAQAKQYIESSLAPTQNDAPRLVKKVQKTLFTNEIIFINSIDNAIDTMTNSGINTVSKKTETNDFIEYYIRIPRTKSSNFISRADVN